MFTIDETPTRKSLSAPVGALIKQYQHKAKQTT